MAPRLVDLGGDHGEVAAILPEEIDESVDVRACPVGNILLFGFEDGFVFLFEFVLEGDLIDEGRESGD